MVRTTAFLVIFFLFSASLTAQDVVVTSQIKEKSLAGRPIKGNITVTHDMNEKVDEKSFLAGQERLDVEFIKDVQISPNSTLVIFHYDFTIPPRDPGLHLLPEVSVVVGGKTYRSIPASFEVEGGTQDSAAGKDPSLVLSLENIIEGDKTLYPGQQIIVGYRFIYTFSVELSREDLPLLKGEGLEKVGAKQTKEFKRGNTNILEVRQAIQAKEKGEFRFPGGEIAGTAYREDRFGRKEYAKSEKSAQTDPVTLRVLPFPEKDKPPSFNGAIGTDLQFDVSLLSSDQVAVGDKIELLIKISGTGELATMPSPEVCCQPGFSGFFRMSDLPPVEELSGDEKTFKVEMRPLSPIIEAIPSLAFSYFNPKEKSYITLKSKPIPITVTPLAAPPTEEQRKVLFEEKAEEEAAPLPEPIEIAGNVPLTSEDMTNLSFGNWWVLLILPLGAALILLQLNMKTFIEKQKLQQAKAPKNSSHLFNEALAEDPGTSSYFTKLQEAFLSRLRERGEIGSDITSPDYLPDEGVPGKVKRLFREIEEKRFSSVPGTFGKEFEQKVEALFKEIKP